MTKSPATEYLAKISWPDYRQTLSADNLTDLAVYIAEALEPRFDGEPVKIMVTARAPAERAA